MKKGSEIQFDDEDDEIVKEEEKAQKEVKIKENQDAAAKMEEKPEEPEEKVRVIQEGQKPLSEKIYIKFEIDNPQSVYYVKDVITGKFWIESTYKVPTLLKTLDIRLKENWQERTKKGWEQRKLILETYPIREKIRISPGQVRIFEFKCNLLNPWDIKTGVNVKDWTLSLGVYNKTGKHPILCYPYEDAQYFLPIDETSIYRGGMEKPIELKVDPEVAREEINKKAVIKDKPVEPEDKTIVIQDNQKALAEKIYVKFEIDETQDIYYLNDEITGRFWIESTFKVPTLLKTVDIRLKENWQEKTKKGWELQKSIIETYPIEEKIQIQPGQVRKFEFTCILISPWDHKSGDNVKEWKLSLGFYTKTGKQSILCYPYEDAQYSMPIDEETLFRTDRNKEEEAEAEELLEAKFITNKCPKCGWTLSSTATRCPMPTCGWDKEKEEKKRSLEEKAQERENTQKRVGEILEEITVIEEEIRKIDKNFWDKLITQEQFLATKTQLYEKLGALQGELSVLQGQ